MMNRKILFRGLRVSNNRWVYGTLRSNNKIRSFCGLTYKVNPKTVGQYVGFNDMYGTAIFEDDKVVHQKYHKKGTKNGTNNWKIVTWLQNRGKVGWNLCPSKHLKIVGNTHERRES